MINPKFIAHLRDHQRAEVVLAWVQFSLACPGKFRSLIALAEELKMDRCSIGRTIKRLQSLGLIRYSTASRRGAIWIWWVKKHEDDQPDPSDEPGWLIRDIEFNVTHRVPMSKRYEWAEKYDIKERAFDDFINKRQIVLYRRWKIVGWP